MPTYQQKLENLFETCVRVARKRFTEDGELELAEWLVEDKHDVRGLIAFAPDIDKDKMLETMRKVVADRDVVRYAVSIETWFAVGEDDTRRPSERPDRMEGIAVFAEDRQGNGASLLIEIERKGGKAFLGEEVKTNDFYGGRFKLFD